MPTLCPSVRVELCLHDRFYATFNNMLLIIKAYLWNNIGQLQHLASNKKQMKNDCFS